MIGLLGSAIQMSAPSPLTRRRDYESFLRGPALAVTDRFGSVAAWRGGAQYLQGLTEFPAPSDAFNGDSGIQESGEVSVQIAGLAVGDEDGTYARLFTLMTDWRNQLVDLDLVTRIYREDGTAVEIINERRALVKSTKRQKNVLALQVVDVDRAALEALIPSKRFTIADFPKLFIDHVNAAVPQATGTALKVPMVYVDNTAGSYKHLICEITTSTNPVILTIYRNGQIVTASEYITDTVTVAGTTYLRATFVKEQRDFQLALYKLEADILAPGVRAASEEIRRILVLLGATADATSFDAAQLYCYANGMLIDCAYVDPRKGIGIIEDLLQVARAQLYKTPSGAYGIFIDRPRDIRLALDDQTDECEVGDYGKPDLTKTLTIEYRPSTSQQEKYSGKLSRTTNGAVGEKVIKNPYIRDHITADRLLCYLQRRENARSDASALVHGVQLAAGDLVAIRSDVTWNGWKNFAAPQVSRPADKNQIELREYDESIYTYAAGTLPADATNGYQPDYSQTPPLAPSGLSVVSQGTSVDNDGKATAYALIRVTTPPTVNWARLQAMVTDTTTNEIYQAQLILNAGNYEATISGLRPNRAHNVKAWAVNATNVDGAVTATVNFTSANYTTAPTTPASVAIAQPTARALRVSWAANTSTNIKEYIVFRSTNSGSSYAEYRRTFANFIDDTNVSVTSRYDYKIRAVDRSLNESADSAAVFATVATWIGDVDINAQGVGGGSIANGSINRGRNTTSTGSGTGSISSLGTVTVGTGQAFTFWVNMGMTGGKPNYCGLVGSSPSNDEAILVIENTVASAQTWYTNYRYVNA